MRRPPYKIVLRLSSQVEKERHDTLDEALASLSARIPQVARRGSVQALVREYEPGSQVAGRLEVHGPSGTHGGIDVRGDGSAEAYVGWIRKRPVERRGDESAIEALRRELLET